MPNGFTTVKKLLKENKMDLYQRWKSLISSFKDEILNKFR